MRPCDEPRDTPDWMPHAAPCRRCGDTDWHSDCPPRDLPPNIILGTE